MSWTYDAERSTLLPRGSLKEVTQGNAAETISIPVAPPSGGYEQPPIPLPPPIPPIPSLPSFGSSLGFVFVPALGGYDGTNAQTWANGTIPGTTIQGINIETDSTAVGAAWGVPLGVTSLYAYPVIANNGIEQTIQIYFTLKGYYLGSASADVSDTTNSSILFTAGDLIWCTDLALTIAVEPGTIASFTTYPNADNDDLALWGWLCVLT